VFWSGVGFRIRRVWTDLCAGNQEKEDIKRKRIVRADGKPIRGRKHADNYAHSVTDAKIAQRGKIDAMIAYGFGVAKECRDMVINVYKSATGQNSVTLKESFLDSCKDMRNNVRGLKWGLENPTGDAEEYFAQLDLAKNEIVEGYNNGIADGKKALAQAMQQQSILAQKEAQVKEEEKRAKDQVVKAKTLSRQHNLEEAQKFGVAPSKKTETKSEVKTTAKVQEGR